MEQDIRFCTAPDGVNLAYATSGNGPPLVRVANWLTHLDLDWEGPIWSHWFREFSIDHTLIRFDLRGLGLSDRSVDEQSLEVWRGDLETIIEDMGIERFPLMGFCQGGAIALSYAVHHPEQVSHLILFDSYSQGNLIDGTPLRKKLETKALTKMIEVGWGRGDTEEGFEAFLWQNGKMTGLGDFPDSGFHSEANGVSVDGSVVVGRSLSDEGFEAFRWTEEEGMVGLKDLPGGNVFSEANAVSSDGSIVVGHGSSEKGTEAFRWTEAGGMVGLGDLPGGSFSSIANAVSPDSSIVAGKSQTNEGFPFGTEAFVWTEENGMQNLKELAEEEYGAVFNGWIFAEATGIGVADDTVIVTGIGMNPLGLREGFRIPLTAIGLVADEASPSSQ